MFITNLILDADETLYPSDTGLVEAVRLRARDFIMSKQNLTIEQVNQRITYFFQSYDSILTGLMAEENINPEEFFTYVFDVPIEKYISPNPKLHKVFQDHNDLRASIFSNSPRNYLERLIKTLGIYEDIDVIFDRSFFNYLPKSNPKIYQLVLDNLRVKGAECLMVDDKPTNLKIAKIFGINTVLIAYDGDNNYSFIDHYISKINQIGKIIDLHNKLVL
jgi:putative hydrolase of the HAD superfamily